MQSGSDDDQERLWRDFTLGFAQSVSYSFKGGYGGERPGAQRSGFRAVLYVCLGVQMTGYLTGYARE